VGMCWDEACDYCDEKVYYDLYVEHQGWRRRNMVASFRGSGVGEEPRDIAIFVRFIVFGVLFSDFPLTQLSSRRSRGRAVRDGRRARLCKLRAPARGRDYRSYGRAGLLRPRCVVQTRDRTVRRAGVKYCEVSK
jgi:hypothetical protein